MPQPRLSQLSTQPTVTGNWTTAYLSDCLKLIPSLQQLKPQQAAIEHLDANGALAFVQAFGRQPEHWPQGLSYKQTQLLQLVLSQEAVPVSKSSPSNPLAKLGQASWSFITQASSFFSFIGQSFIALVSILKKPQRFKFKLWLDVLQKDGLYALPLVAVLAFLLGAVVAWQGALQLKTYGANIFIVELVALTHLRELGPLITAILVAGRSGSAYAAQLATMQINQEVLALKSLGQDPFDWLVTPKILGLILALPLLTLVADISGLLGGSLIAQIQLDIDPSLFWQRLSAEVNIINFYIGMIKAPVFALIIVNVGCLQGLLAKGGADAVGQRTTRSVVQAIFLVIITDAIFSIIFSDLG